MLLLNVPNIMLNNMIMNNSYNSSIKVMKRVPFIHFCKYGTQISDERCSHLSFDIFWRLGHVKLARAS